jgi:hypothetical protein
VAKEQKWKESKQLGVSALKADSPEAVFLVAYGPSMNEL